MKKSIFLFSGITAGLIFIFLGIFDNQKLDKTQSNIIALVNDHPILQSDLDLALSGILIPEEFGGSGLGVLEAALIAEEFGRYAVPTPCGSK